MAGIKRETRTSRRFLECICSVMMLGPFALCAPLAAAVTSLSGNITDPQGSVVAGATVRLFRQADSSRRETQTDSQGQFSFSQVDSGEYRLTVEYPGFAPVMRAITLSDGNWT